MRIHVSTKLPKSRSGQTLGHRLTATNRVPQPINMCVTHATRLRGLVVACIGAYQAWPSALCLCTKDSWNPATSSIWPVSLVLHDVLGHTHERMKVTGIGPTVLLFDDFRSGLHFQGRVLLRCWGLPGLGLRLIGYTRVCRRNASNRTKNSDSGEVS